MRMLDFDDEVVDGDGVDEYLSVVAGVVVGDDEDSDGLVCDGGVEGGGRAVVVVVAAVCELPVVTACGGVDGPCLNTASKSSFCLSTKSEPFRMGTRTLLLDMEEQLSTRSTCSLGTRPNVFNCLRGGGSGRGDGDELNCECCGCGDDGVFDDDGGVDVEVDCTTS